jgi:prefoldin subunit 5
MGDTMALSLEENIHNIEATLGLIRSEIENLKRTTEPLPQLKDNVSLNTHALNTLSHRVQDNIGELSLIINEKVNPELTDVQSTLIILKGEIESLQKMYVSMGNSITRLDAKMTNLDRRLTDLELSAK